MHAACLTTGSEDFKHHNKSEGAFRFATLLFLFHTGICGRNCTPQVQRLHIMHQLHVCIHWYHGNLKPRCLSRVAYGVGASCSAISNKRNLNIFPARVTNLVRETISNGGSWESVAVDLGTGQWRTGKWLYLYRGVMKWLRRPRIKEQVGISYSWDGIMNFKCQCLWAPHNEEYVKYT